MCKISFRNIKFSVDVKSTKQEIADGAAPIKPFEILKDCSGYCLPGELTFIMGASGAGKTSLLNLMSDRVGAKPGMHMSGAFTFNDSKEISLKSFSMYGSYVMQDDVLFSYFTVKEAITFAARLKLRVSH